MSEAQRALELDPFSLAVRTMTGWVLFSQRRYDDALDVWQGVLELEPDQSTGWPSTTWGWRTG